jgi:uncharacterized delta-60 repeat protein
MIMKNKHSFFVLTLLLFAGKLFSQAGVLDVGFGNNGIVITHATDFNEGYSVAMQTDGKIVVGGYSGNYGLEDYAVWRYNTNGSIDNTFGTGGRTVTPVCSGTDRGQCVLLQPDGKIILTGYSTGGQYPAMTTVRYLTNGTIDTTFGTQGIVITNLPGNGPSYAWTAALQTDGKIVVGGIGPTPPYGELALVRYNSSGTLDMSFGTNGMLTTDMSGSNNYNTAFGIQLQPDGKIVASAYVYDGTRYKFGVARFNTDGSLDNSFGTNGKVISTIGFDDVANGIALQQDGKIIVCGYTWRPGYTDTDITLVRYNTDGTLDTSFGNAGVVIDPDSLNYGYLRVVTIQPDGKIIGAGQYGIPGANDFLAVRFNTDGSFDTTFNSTGKAIDDINGTNDQDYACAVTLQTDGKIVVAGATVISSLSDVDIAVVRYLASPDVGVVDFSVDNNSVFVYPNPVNGNAMIEYTLTQAEKISIGLTDMQGRIIYSFVNNEMQQAGKQQQAFELPEVLAAGTYLLMLSTEQGSVSIKIMK